MVISAAEWFNQVPITEHIETTVEILLVEDNPADTLLMAEALWDSPMANELRVVRNGDEALDFLITGDRSRAAPGLTLSCWT